MSTPEILDFARLMAPIPGDKPTGLDLREDTSPVSDYYAIRDARKTASDAERRIDKGDDKVEPPDWRAVRERAVKGLAERSKDLEVAAILIESLVRLNGFAGLRDGFRLARELVEQFWENLYPSAREGDVQDRFSHILQLNGIDSTGALIVPIRKIPFTEMTSLGVYSLTHYHLARTLAQVADAKVRQKRIDEGAITLEMIQKAVSETSAKFYVNLTEDIKQATDEILRFGTVFNDRSGYDPPSSQLIEVIESYNDIVKDLAREKLPKAVPSAPGTVASPVSQETPGASAAPAPVDPGVIRSREDAFDRLKKIADYFREHEPQSVIPYALDQVAGWGKMTLPELMAELIPDEGPRKNFFKQVGIKQAEVKK
jgi:type VI secretion system protein ImpA